MNKNLSIGEKSEINGSFNKKITINNNYNLDNKELGISDNILQVKKSFIDSLEKIEFGGFSLTKLFVWPEFYFISGDEEKNIDGSFNLIIEGDNKACFIKGVSLSGKTSIGKKIFLEGIELDYFPILINGDLIVKGNLNFKKILEKEFSDQYNGKFNNFFSKKNKIIIVDNYHIGINKQFIEFCKNNFIKIIFLISEDDFIMYFNDDKNYIDFDIYGINSFNKIKKHELIVKWLKKDYQNEDEVYTKSFDSLENRIDEITSTHSLPMFPFYLLSIIQAFDNISTKDFQITSYGHCYYALIISQLDKKGIDPAEWEFCLNFLMHLAYYIYKSKGDIHDGITKKDYIDFKIKYNNNYAFMTKSTLSKLENTNYSILREDDNSIIRFEFEYVYYYFIGKYIATIDDSNILEIEKLTESIYKKSSSNILIFTIHNTNNLKLLEEIQLHCITIFDNFKPTTLSKEDTEFLNNLINKLPESILNNKTISENRKDIEKNKDLNDKKKTFRELSDNQIEADKELLELSKSFKILDVLGQILKNRSGNLKKDILENLLLDIENLGLRLMAYMLNMIKSDDFFNSIKNKIDLYEKMKGNVYISDNEKINVVENYIQSVGFRVIIGLLYKIFQSVGIEQLTDIQRSIKNKNNTPAFNLLYSLFNINFGKFNLNFLKELYTRFSGEKNSLGIKTLSFFIQGYMNTHYIKQNERQSLCKMLGIKYFPNKVLKSK